MIKIVSGHSYPAGSSVALVNLCNELNTRGYPCVFYGPDNWHIDQCASGTLDDFDPKDGDIVLLHDIELLSTAELYDLSSLTSGKKRNSFSRTLVRRLSGYLSPATSTGKFKLLLTCREGEGGRRLGIRDSLFNKIHFASAAQNNLRKTKQPKFACPDFLADLRPSKNKPPRTAGIIGSISKENETEVAIERALQEGMDAVILYGYLADPIYYYSEIQPLIKLHPGKIKFAGFMDDQQKMYDSVSDVYVSAGRPWSKVVRECALTNTGYHGSVTGSDANMTNNQIFEIWKKELEL